MNNHSLECLLRKVFSELPSEQIYNVQQAAIKSGVSIFYSPTKIADAISIDDAFKSRNYYNSPIKII
jgi:hypothetical protein